MSHFDEQRARGASAAERLAAATARSAEHADNPIWIERLDAQASLALAGDGALAGLTFAIKDNIDLAGVPTTAACPAYGYTPTRSATVVQRLLDAGALPLGKTNLDQFATGLVGTRSPYGACRSAVDPLRISGGSSAGSAVAVALGEADFALGTDTAGSGRVPASFNGLVGFKPSRGLLPNTGVVPACASLDCVTTFTRGVADAAELLAVVAGPDGIDPAARELSQRYLPTPVTIGVPATDALGFADASWGPEAFEAARARLEAIGCTLVEIDPAPFVDAGALLYDGPWVAERAVAVGEFIASHPDDVHPVTAGIITKADAIDARDAFRGFDALRALAARTASIMAGVDAIMMPTTDRFPTLAEVDADPVGVNTALGRFTNFMNLLDYAAITVPVADPGPLPFGVTLFAPAGHDHALLELGAAFTGETITHARGYELVVCGAHMDGLPLNHQLTDRGGRFLKRCRTAPGHRLFALPGGPPERPALLADPTSDASIEVEVWDLPEESIGSFLAGIPAPLGLGKVRLDDGRDVVGFIGAAGADRGARDVTEYGGWRAWLAARSEG